MQTKIPFVKLMLYVFSLCINAVQLFGQIREDSVYLIVPIEVNGYRYNDYQTGSKSIRIDSSYLRHNPGNLSEVLSAQSSLYIKNYGPSGIAGISMRGGSSSHTQTTMNGMIINSPTLGQSDYASIPSFLFNTLSIQYGSQITLMGSGAIGGSIHLSNEASFVKKKQIEITYQQASFGSHLPILTLQIGNMHHQLTIKAYYRQANNTISYYKNTLKEKLNHAQQQQAGTYIDYSVRIKNHTIQYWLWYQQMDTNVPGTISAPISEAKKFERNVKQGIQWKYAKNRSSIQSRVGVQNDVMNFDAGMAFNPSLTTTQVVQAEAEYRYALHPFMDLLAGSQVLIQNARAENFNTAAQQNKIGIFITSKIRLFKNRLEFAPSIRKEWCNQQWIPISPSLGAEYRVSKAITMHTLTSYNYRIPTLNDLYYKPGGNLDLKPEYGWSYEGGISIEKKNSVYRFFQDITGYTRTIADWIQWLPPETGIHWIPVNIQQVWSRGLESESSLSFKMNKQTLAFKNSFAYTKSTNVSVLADADKQHKQLIYVPLFKNSLSTSFSGKHISTGIIYNYTSWSFITSDNTDYINPHHLFDVYGMVQWPMAGNRYHINLQARINNLFNSSYQVVANRPMPLRNYQITLTLTYN